MIKPKSFRKLPECDTCLFYTANLMLPCQIHPRGVKGEFCLDYRDDPSAERNWQQFLGLDTHSGLEIDSGLDTESGLE